MTADQKCPECGGLTTEKAVTFANGPWEGKGDRWRSCLDCEWNNKEADS